MYKVAKRTLVDLNITKIYLLKVKSRKYCIHVKIVFSINKEDDYYQLFVKDTLKYTRPDTQLFKLEDYVQYLADNCEYDSIADKEIILFTDDVEEDTDTSLEYKTMYLSPCPFGNLLEQSVEGLIQLNYPKLQLSPSGLFTYHEFVDNTNTTRGILKDLRRLQSGKEVNTNTTDECWLYRAIKALDLHWN